MATVKEIQTAKARIKGKKYGDLDDILTASSGRNQSERAKWRADLDYWMGVRRGSKVGSKKRRDAESKISQLMGI